MEISYLYENRFNLLSFIESLVVLKNKGYSEKFRRNADCLFCIGLYQWVYPDEFNVDETYYFSNVSLPDTDRIIYAITTSNGIKGILVDSDRVYVDNMSLALIEKLEDKKQRII